MPEASVVLARVHAVVRDLELISEAPASKPLDSERVRGGNGADDMPTERTLLDRHLVWLEEWCIRAEHDRDRHKYRPPNAPKGETPSEFRKRVIKQYEGVHDLEVSKREAASRRYIRDIRVGAHRDKLYGTPLPEDEDARTA
jgi:hypothetical protein